MAKYNRWRYKVTGRGYFPLDMLRYDHCWPAGSDDIARLAVDDLASERRAERTISVCGVMHPSAARWESFGWRVSNIEGFKV